MPTRQLVRCMRRPPRSLDLAAAQGSHQARSQTDDSLESSWYQTIVERAGALSPMMDGGQDGSKSSVQARGPCTTAAALCLSAAIPDFPVGSEMVLMIADSAVSSRLSRNPADAALTAQSPRTPAESSAFPGPPRPTPAAARRPGAELRQASGSADSDQGFRRTDDRVREGPHGPVRGRGRGDTRRGGDGKLGRYKIC